MMTGALNSRHGTHKSVYAAGFVIWRVPTEQFFKMKTDTMRRIYSIAKAAVFVSGSVLPVVYHWTVL